MSDSIVQADRVELPLCSVQYPACGSCGGETDHDGDSFYCDECGLDYGDGDDCTPATFRDEEEERCANPCDNQWHNSIDIGPYDCGICQLPASHKGSHWTNCKPTIHGVRR